MIEPTALYRFFDAGGRLLYAGITSNIPLRLGQHNREKPWWVDAERVELEHFATRREALEAESKAIRTEHPYYNIMGRVAFSAFEELMHLEPRLAELAAEASDHRRGDPEYCVNRVWYGIGQWTSIRDRMRRLVGWERGPGDFTYLDARLQSTEAFEVAYRNLLELLEPCHPCQWCSGKVDWDTVNRPIPEDEDEYLDA